MSVQHPGMVVFNCFNYHCWFKLFLKRSWSVSLMPSMLPTVNSVRQTLVFLSWPCLLWSWSKLPSYSHASWGLSHFAGFKLILLFPLCSQLAFLFFSMFVHFIQRKISFVVFVVCHGDFYTDKQFNIAWLPGLDWGNTSLLCPEFTEVLWWLLFAFLSFFGEQFLSFYFR